MKLSKLRPTVFERAAKRVLNATSQEWGDRFACLSLVKEGGGGCCETQAFKYFFGPKDSKGRFVSRDWASPNIKNAPRPVREHPFWDRDSIKPELQAIRATALLTMAAMVRSAKENKAHDQEF